VSRISRTLGKAKEESRRRSERSAVRRRAELCLVPWLAWLAQLSFRCCSSPRRSACPVTVAQNPDWNAIARGLDPSGTVLGSWITGAPPCNGPESSFMVLLQW